jgi:hypothetical protein
MCDGRLMTMTQAIGTHKKVAKKRGSPPAKSTRVAMATGFMRAWGPPGTSHTMDGSASIVRTPLREVHVKGTREDFTITGEGGGAGKGEGGAARCG